MRYYTSTSGEMILQAGISPSDTTITVDTTAGLPGSYPYVLFLDYGSASEEIVDVTGAASTTLTVTRGRDGTVAQSHAFGAKIRHGITARDLRESREHEAATGAHGVATVAGLDEVQTFDNKTFEPDADHTAVVFRARATNTAPLSSWEDSSGTVMGNVTEAGIFSLWSSNTWGSFYWGGAVNVFKAILSLRIASDIHGIVGNAIAGATGRFLRLMSGATELFYVASNGDLKANAATFTSNVGVTGNVAASGTVAGSNITALQTQANTLDTKMTAVEGRATSLEGRATTLETSGVWQDYPAVVLSDSTGITAPGSTVTFARYCRVGKMMSVVGEAFTGSGIVTNVAVTLPTGAGLTPARRHLNAGSFSINHASAPAQSGLAQMTASMLRITSTPLTSAGFNDAPVGSALRWNLIYEIA